MEKVETSVVADIAVREIWKHLEGDQQGLFAKVHARAQWAFEGVPELYTCNGGVLPIEGRKSSARRSATDHVKRPNAALAADGQDDTENFSGSPIDAARGRQLRRARRGKQKLMQQGGH